MTFSAAERLEAELSLLSAMYPSTLTFTPQCREVNYTSIISSKSTMTLRLPDQYPEQGLPELISARDGPTKSDVRDETRRAIEMLGLEKGFEILDQIINVFEEVVSSREDTAAAETQGDKVPNPVSTPGQSHPKSKTVIIWLHHLLATSKRKLAITPTTTSTARSTSGISSSRTISGITKPGYPGILLFSGPSDLVNAHVHELKTLNWRAFQIRYDSSEDTPTTKVPSTSRLEPERDGEKGNGNMEWEFSHGRGKIVEVETMADVVKGIVSERNREIFLRAAGVK
ncbi:uncharacterized protein Z518_08277 [Rhinocladiella mackenziei CBS 650.93]|uniref:RWD domain-containing protein n=1 Tax=Rhinocladiella mackenziei CBS 650.93 TaxID=1442369 RepID=A0A0D2IGD2_9EURO|nr:uncharacterized protein Z518_08277 [Rhinocladiella mackenziei CBS 650.93]KIX02336.1 hypothetical protein Z518_08277 [Rhinocladiella mackenziei CBS 650.93]